MSVHINIEDIHRRYDEIDHIDHDIEIHEGDKEYTII